MAGTLLFPFLALLFLGAQGRTSPPRKALAGKSGLPAGSRRHPRIFAGEERFRAVRREIGKVSLLGKWYGRLLREGRKVLSAPPSRYEIPDGLRLLATSRRVLRRVLLLAFLYKMDPSRRDYLERAWKELEAAARFPDWNPRHFLDTAEMTAAFAVGYDWLHDSWSEERRKILARAVLEKGFRPALLAYRGKARFGWWVKARHNWNQVCNGGIGLGALAFAEVYPEEAGEILEGIRKSLPLALARLAPDGGWEEGPGYWGYANRYTAFFLSSLRTSLGGDFGLSSVPGMDVTGLFPIYLTGPTGRTFNFADCHDGPIYGPVFFWLAGRFGRAVYAAHETGTPRPGPLDLLWYTGKGLPPGKAGLAPDRLFRRVQVFSFRSSWSDREGLFLAGKGGSNRANHGHLDLGSFVLDAGGVRWALDLGSDDYNLPGYWSGGRRGRRWSYYRLRAEGHNTLVLNPGKGPDQDPSARAEVIRFRGGRDPALAVLDLGKAYGRDAGSVLRGFLFSRKGKWVLVQDEVVPAGKKPDVLWWFLHTRASVKLGKSGRRALLRRNGRVLEALLLSPAGAGFSVLPAEPLPSSPSPGGQRKNGGVRKLALRLEISRPARTAVLLRLLPREGKGCGGVPVLKPLKDW